MGELVQKDRFFGKIESDTEFSVITYGRSRPTSGGKKVT